MKKLEGLVLVKFTQVSCFWFYSKKCKKILLRGRYYNISIESLRSYSNHFLKDAMVEPRESSHFEFYEEGQGKIKVPLRESALYTEDRLGLKVSMISKQEY